MDHANKQVLTQSVLSGTQTSAFQISFKMLQCSWSAEHALCTGVFAHHPLACSRRWLTALIETCPPTTMCYPIYLGRPQPHVKSEYFKYGKNPNWVVFTLFVCFFSECDNNQTGKAIYLCRPSVSWFVNSHQWFMGLYWIKWLFLYILLFRSNLCVFSVFVEHP